MDETEEINQPRVLPAEKTRLKLNIKIGDIIVFAVVVIIVVGLSTIIIQKLSTKHDVVSAQKVSDQLTADIAKRDGAAALKLGSKKFQTTYSAAALTSQFKAIELVTGGKPKAIQQTIGSGSAGKTVFIIYEYPAHLAKLPYFIQVAIDKKSGTPWQLESISGSADETTLSSY